MITGGGRSSSRGGRPSQDIQTVISDDNFSETSQFYFSLFQFYLNGSPSKIILRASIKTKW